LIAAGWAAVIVVDAGGSLISIATGIPYGYFAFVSFAIYAAIGIAACRMGGSIKSSAYAGLAVALFDGTVGWWVSSAIGPARIPPAAGPLLVVVTVAIVIAVDTVLAVAAGAAWRALAASRRSRK